MSTPLALDLLPTHPFAWLPDSCAFARDIYNVDDGIAASSVPVAAASSIPVAIASSIPVIIPSPVPCVPPAWPPVADTYLTAGPIKIVVQPGTDSEADTEGDRWGRVGIIGFIGFNIDDFRVVPRHVNDLFLRRHDANVALFLDNFLLRSIDQVARGSGLNAELLNRVHHVSRLIEKGVANLGCPFKVLIHPIYNLRITGE
jgi:hypothetical protein